MRIQRRIRRGLAIAAAALSLVALAPEPAPAQGLFGSLFGLRGRPVERYYAPYHSYAPTGDPWAEILRSREREAADPRLRAEGPRQVYCVRLCDGSYFPLPRSVGVAVYSPAKTCSALCPAAETKIFAGRGIGPSVAPDGTRYAKLENTFAYRERVIDGCTCNGTEPGGLARIDAESDPTLKPGDVVVTQSGPEVFKGGKPPHRADNFTPAEDYKKLPKGLREQLSEMRVAPTGGLLAAQPASPPPAANPPPRDLPAAQPWRELALARAQRDLAARQNLFSGLASQFTTR